ncbi:MAG: SWIM zinc finger family protein [Acidobacteria bacterium]|nr:SWIM zinc finger family protein [Acidobacteriota bacterium]
MYYDIWKPYVPVAKRRAQAARKASRLAKKGHTLSPVVIDGRTIATTFWGKAWCSNLERYSDYANRLPRGRTYVRNGSVFDLRTAPGTVAALVSGSDVYEIEVKVASLPKTRWHTVCKDCAGAIDSLVELLQGRFSKAVMGRLCQANTGLFPSPKEITFTCSCPDWASMCKHVAAVLYGIGARLDKSPDLLFTLRKVDQQDLITSAGKGLQRRRKGPAPAKILDTGDLSEIFGIEMAQTAAKPTRKSRRPRSK